MTNRIADETVILPEVIADSVLREVELWSGIELDTSLADYLTTKAERIYANNAAFAKKLKCASGRDFLYSFMRHWLTDKLGGKVNGVKLPASFANGIRMHEKERAVAV